MDIFSRSKGQSAIEYLTTYGWMLIVVVIVGGSVFTLVQDRGQVNSVDGLNDADVQISDFGVSDSGLQAEIRAASSEEIENANLSITNTETGEKVYANKEVDMPVTGSDTVEFPGIESSEGTNTYEVSITYTSGDLENLTVNGTITGNIQFGSSTEETSNDGTNDGGSGGAVAVSGGSITAMATTSTFGNSSNVICVGPDCSETNPSPENENVSREGDVMTGTLKVDNITDQATTCFGEHCTIETGSYSGDLGVDGNDMDGTLNVTEIKPDSASQICAGTEC